MFCVPAVVTVVSLVACAVWPPDSSSSCASGYLYDTIKDANTYRRHRDSDQIELSDVQLAVQVSIAVSLSPSVCISC